MRYLALIYSDERTSGKQTPEQLHDEMGVWWKYTEDLQKSGVMLGGDALQPTATATTVRLSNGEPIITDGPFAETKEQLGGFYMYNAANLDEAIKWAAKMPNLPRGGSVEIRPIMELGDAPES